MSHFYYLTLLSRRIFASKKIMTKTQIILFQLIAIIGFSCSGNTKENPNNIKDHYEKEKQAIIETIHTETKAAFQKDYEGWKAKWVHDPSISKTYMNFVDSSYSESIGWNDINNFVKTYIEKNPEPDQVPTLADEFEVRLYGNGAWVVFEQHDPKRGLKRETRLLEKIDGTWKIAGMHTSIYGFKED